MKILGTFFGFICASKQKNSISKKGTTESFNPFVPNAPFFYPLKTSERVHLEQMGKIYLIDVLQK